MLNLRIHKLFFLSIVLSLGLQLGFLGPVAAPFNIIEAAYGGGVADGAELIEGLGEEVVDRDVLCRGILQASRNKGFETGALTNEAVQEFAIAHHLPMRVIEVGPLERRVQRLVVGLDMTDEALMKDYYEKFNFRKSPKEGIAASLVLEFAWEQQKIATNGESAGYITGVFRPDAEMTAPIYRWGRPDLSYSAWKAQWLFGKNPLGADAPVFGFSHILGLTDAEKANVEIFLANKDLRAKCKADNCVAWTSTIELGTTALNEPDANRKFLFSELGMSRSMAHFEIGRRLVHAANERHTSIFVFLNGAKGKEAFSEIEKYLPPNPKIPYINVIKGLGLPPDSPILQAMKVIPNKAKIFFPIAAGASPEGFTALVQYAGTLPGGVDIHLLVNGISESAIQNAVSASGDQIRIHGLFLGGNLRKVYHEGKVDVIPGYLGDFPKLVAEGHNSFQYDAMIVRVSPPDASGHYSLGPNNDMIMSILRARPNIKVIAEVNPNVPFTTGKNYLLESEIASKFTSNVALAGPAVVPLTDVETKIGNYLGDLIDSGSTLQIGIGNIFGGLTDGLVRSGKKDIRAFTEMFGDPLMDSMKAGVITRAETGFAYGSDGLYKWLDHNEYVRFEETGYINDPARVAGIEHFHAVNTALQVDLYGNVNAMIGPDGKRMSSSGGQVEFMSGASKSKYGKAIIAIRSTAKGGTVSTITMDLYRGPVTTPHEMVTHVVTEYGVANLSGKSERDRALALIQVAHPVYRKELAQQALERGLIKEADLARF